MTFEDAVWIGLGIHIEPPVLAKIEQHGQFFDVRVRQQRPDWTQKGEAWVTALILTDERDAEEQAARWQAKLEANPYALAHWDMTENRL